MKRALLNDPEHWRERAANARALAEDITDPEAKKAMLKIAAEYEGLAKRADQRLLTELAKPRKRNNKR